MNKSTGGGGALSKPIPVSSPGSRPTSTISSLSSQEYSYDDQLEETTQSSSWATYTDDLDRLQQNKIFLTDSFFDEEEDTIDIVAPWSASAKKLNGQCRKNMFKNKMNVKMSKGGSPSSVVDDDLKDTASSPNNSPTVSYMSQLNMMKLRTSSTAQEKMGKLAEIPDNNSNKKITELQKRGLCLVPLSSMTFDLDQV